MHFSRLLHATLLLSAVTTAGCAQDDAPPASAPTGEQAPSAVRTGYIQLAKDDQPHPVTFEDVNGQAMFEGDIMLGSTEEFTAAKPPGPGHVSALGVSITGAGYRWPGGVVPFVIDPTLPDPARVTNAIAHWEARTNLRFVARNTFNALQYPNYIVFRSKDGCWSQVGMRGGEQEISLATGCWTPAAIHEIGHAIGLWHEQSREDRDSFIRIRWENVEAWKWHNFDQHIGDGDDRGAYDFASIMHYDSHVFSSNGLPTIEKLDGSLIVRGTVLSPGDIASARALYPDFVDPTATHFRTGDFNGDGRTDWSWYWPRANTFVVALSTANGITRVYNDTSGWGDWSNGRFFSTGDFNGDGRTDWSWYAPSSNQFTVMFSNGDGTYRIVNNNTSGWGNWSDGKFFSTGDFNGDGRTDWSWYAPWSNGFDVMLSNGNGSYTIVETNTSGWGNWSDGKFFSTGDFNGDGRDDWSWYAPWSNQFTVMLSNGNGTYRIVNNNTAGWGDWSNSMFFNTGDFNGDGRDDWSFYVPWNNDFRVLLSTGTGAFTATQNVMTGWGNWSGARFFSTGDFNGNGRTDWSWYAPWSNAFIEMLSNGNGTFSAMETNTSGWGNWSDGRFFSTGDFNGDGRTDWSWYAPWSHEFIVMKSTGTSFSL